MLSRRSEARADRALEGALGALRPASRGVVMAIAGLALGAGATTTALALAELYARGTDLRVLLVDADPAGGTLAERASARPARSLDELGADLERLGPAGDLAPYRTPLAGGADLIPGPAGLSAERLGQVVAHLTIRYDLILLDLGSSAGSLVAAHALAHADRSVLVARPEPPAEAPLVAALAALEGRRECTTLVLNRVRPEAWRARQALEAAALGRVGAIARLPEEPALAHAPQARGARARPLSAAGRTALLQLALAAAGLPLGVASPPDGPARAPRAPRASRLRRPSGIGALGATALAVAGLALVVGLPGGRLAGEPAASASSAPRPAESPPPASSEATPSAPIREPDPPLRSRAPRARADAPERRAARALKRPAAPPPSRAPASHPSAAPPAPAPTPVDVVSAPAPVPVDVISAAEPVEVVSFGAPAPAPQLAAAAELEPGP
jgi:cellulose biosynthesis protein BcsQ